MRTTGQLINLAEIFKPDKKKWKETPFPMTDFEQWRLARIPECQICGARNRNELRIILINLRDEIARLREQGYFAEAIMMEEAFSPDKLHDMYNGSRVDIDAVVEGVQWEVQQ